MIVPVAVKVVATNSVQNAVATLKVRSSATALDVLVNTRNLDPKIAGDVVSALVSHHQRSASVKGREAITRRVVMELLDTPTDQWTDRMHLIVFLRRISNQRAIPLSDSEKHIACMICPEVAADQQLLSLVKVICDSCRDSGGERE